MTAYSPEKGRRRPFLRCGSIPQRTDVRREDARMPGAPTRRVEQGTGVGVRERCWVLGAKLTAILAAATTSVLIAHNFLVLNALQGGTAVLKKRCSDGRA